MISRHGSPSRSSAARTPAICSAFIEQFIRPGRVGRRVGREAGFRVFGLQRNGRLSAAALGGDPFFAVIARLVRGDAEKPGLEPAFAVEGIEVFDDGQKDFLANFLGIFAGEIGRELENETPRRRVMQIEQFVPRFRFAATAARQQCRFRVHAVSTLFQACPFEQNFRGSILRGVPSDSS